MFNSKKENLFGDKSKKTSVTSKSAFIKAGLKESAKTLSGNQALKYDKTDDEFVTQFGSLAAYRALRNFDAIASDMSRLWATDPKDAVKFTIYLRMITRRTQLMNGETTEDVQRGAGLRHEAIMRMIWLHINHPEAFWNNIPLFISAGSWKDIFQMLSYDLQYNGWDKKVLDWSAFASLIMVGLENPKTSDLVKKYLPQIQVKSKCKTVEAQADTMIGKFLASKLFYDKNDSYKSYRKLKTSGSAHEWQKLISQGKFKKIDFNTVHGKALMLMVSSKFLENQKLEGQYLDWIKKQPIAKFTGYPFELFSKYATYAIDNIDQKPYQAHTINKQFETLVRTAKDGAKKDTSLIVVRDTSGSMSSQANGVNVSCDIIAKSLALFFSEMLPAGHFADAWIEFNDKAKMHKWIGSTVVEKWNNDKSSFIGSTNFQSVIALLNEIKSTGVPESEFPTGILCISDGEFNKTSLDTTNVNAARTSLRNAGFSEEYIKNFQIVLWNLRNNYYHYNDNQKFETYESEEDNVFYFSGFDGSVISFLTGMEKVQEGKKEPKNAKELFEAAMDQELLNLVKL